MDKQHDATRQARQVSQPKALERLAAGASGSLWLAGAIACLLLIVFGYAFGSVVDALSNVARALGGRG